MAQARDRTVEHGHIGAHARGHARRVGADDAAADHDDAGGKDARHAAHQHAASAIGLLQRPGAHLRRKATRYLGHRREERQAAPIIRDRLIGDAGRPRGDQVMRLLRVGREVQIGEKDLAFPQHLALGGLRLLHLHDHVRLGEDALRVGQDARALCGVIVVRKARAVARARLDQDLVAMRDRFGGGFGRDADAKFLRLDFRGTTDLHLILLGAFPDCRALSRKCLRRISGKTGGLTQ